jgi:uroporphyrinogen decarboxylase
MQPTPTTRLDLTPRERLLAALRGAPVDRVPVWLMRQAGRYLPEYQAVRSRYDFLDLCKTPAAAAEVSIQPVEIVGSDAVIIFNDILVPLEAAGARVSFGDHGPEIANPLRAENDLARLTTRPLTPDEPVAGAIATVRERLGPDFPILGFIGSPWTLAAYWVEGSTTRNFEHLLRLRWSAPESLERILEHITQYATDYLRLQIEAGADAVQIFDTWGGVLADAHYERFSARWIRRIIDEVRPLGVPVIVYLNGGAPYLRDLAALGADCISVDWRLSLARAREALGPDLALQGNLDPLVLYATPEAVEAEVRRIFDAFPPGPGHVFNLGHGILPKTPVDNVKTLIAAVKRYGAC